jgi:truncated hemoglobin YjbI
MRHPSFRILACAILFCAGTVVRADDDLAGYQGLPPGAIRQLGGVGGIKNVVDVFYSIVEHDNRLAQTLFADSTPELREAQKKALIDTLTGKPAVASGTAQAGVVKLTDTQYNALVEDLYDAFDQARVSYHAANRVMGSLSPYKMAMVSAYLMGKPSTQGPMGQVQVGAPAVQPPAK